MNINGLDIRMPYKKLARMIAGVQTREQLLVSLRYAQRVAITTGENALTANYINLGALSHKTIALNILMPATTGIIGKTQVVYNLDPEIILTQMWPVELNEVSAC